MLLSFAFIPPGNCKGQFCKQRLLIMYCTRCTGLVQIKTQANYRYTTGNSKINKIRNVIPFIVLNFVCFELKCVNKVQDILKRSKRIFNVTCYIGCLVLYARDMIY